MRKHLLILMLTLFTLTAHAQTVQRYRSTIFLTGGISIPGSEFADATGIDVKDYVDRGVFASVSFKRDVYKHLAVGFTGGYSRNELNEKAIAEASSTRIETVPWTSTFLVADFYGQLPMRNWNVYLRGSVGAMLPNDWDFYAEQNNNNGTMLKGTTSTTDDVNLAYMTGVGISYSFNRLVVGVESGVLTYKPEFDIDLNGSPGTRSEWIATLNQTLSIGYRF